MAVTIRCPNPACARSSSVSAVLVGHAVRCPHCRTKFKVPATLDGTPPAADQTQASEVHTAVGFSPGAGAEIPRTAPSAPASDLPARIGRFEVCGLLGAGAFGTVYRAYDPQLDREVALKVPRPGTLDSRQRVERFLREAKAAARLRHPNIVPVYEAGSDGTLYYIASAFIEGQTLAEAISEAPLDFRRAAGLVVDLAQALAYVHHLGIVHRDVKSANVLLDWDGQPFLTDFGLAHLETAERLTCLGSVLGTPAYMAPEQADGQNGAVRPASDQYSLGVILYELLCGRVPFGGPPQIVLFNAVHTPPPAPRTVNPAVPPGLEAICLKALQKRPEERYPDCRDLAEALAAWLQEGLAPQPAKPIPLGKLAAPASAEVADRKGKGKHVAPPRRPVRPALRKKDIWSNPLILICGGLGLVLCLLIAIIQLIPPTPSDDPAPPAKGADQQARANPKKEDDKNATDAAKGKQEKEQPADDKKSKKGTPEDGDKGKEGNGTDGGKKETQPVTPKGPPEVPPGPPSTRASEVAVYKPPTRPAAAVLLQYQPERSEWQRLEHGLKAPRVWTARPLVSLPGFRSVVQTDSGVRLTLVGTMPEFFPGVPALFESLVELHQHDQLDLDLTLRRGRILLANAKGDRPLRVRVRFENTINPDAKEIWDITLEDKDAEVLIDRWGFYEPNEPFYANPKNPDRKGPTSQIGLVVLRGDVSLKTDDVTNAMSAPPGRALISWNSRKGAAQGPTRLDKLFDWASPNAPVPKESEAVRADMQRVTKLLNIDLTGRTVDAGLKKALDSTDRGLQKLAVRCYGALDMLTELTDALADEKRPDVRRAVIDTLRHWCGSSRDNDHKLFAELKQRYTPIESEKIVSRLHYFPNEALRQRETYATLIDELDATRLPIRELASWHLYQLVPEAAKTIPFAAAAAPQDLQRVHAAWRKLSRSWPGGIPPQFAQGAGAK